MSESLFELGEIYKKKFSSLKEYELIEKIVPSKNDLIQIAEQLKSFLSMSGAFNVLEGKKEIISVFLVGCAKYYYNDGEGGFWKSVKDLIGFESITQRTKLIDIFEKTLNCYSLNTFEELKEESYKNLAPIIAHSGLPINLSKNLFDGLSYVMSQNVSYNDLSEETMFSCRYSSPNVQRYLKTLNNNGLLSDYVSDIIEFVADKKTTPDDALSIPVIFQEELIKWISEKGAENIDKQRGYKRPRLKYDINSNNIILETPLLILSNISQITWEINTGIDTIRKKIYAEDVNGTNRFRNTSFILNNIDSINVKLLDDLNNPIYTIEMKDSKELLTFNNYGQLNKTKFILNNGAFILIDNSYQSQNELDYIKKIGNCSLYYQQATDEKEEVIFENENAEKLIIKIKRPFELVGDCNLLGDNCSFNGINAYYEMPQIQVPLKGDWQISLNVNDYSEEKNLSIGDYCIELSNVFDRIEYGKVSVRLYNNEIGYKTFKFLYLPNIKIDLNRYFPSNNGYDSNKIKFENSESCYICNGNHEKCDEISISKNDDIISLFYNYKGNEFSFDITVKPFTWSIEGDGELIGQVNRKSYISTKDIKANKNTILSIKNNYRDDIFIKIDGNKEDLYKVLCIKKNTERFIDLREYFELFSSAEGKTNIYLEVNHNKLCEVCEIKANLTISNLKITPMDDAYIFTWDEDGACVNREMLVRNLYKPYESITIPIKDKELAKFININDIPFRSNSIVEIVSNEINSNMFELNTDKKEKLIETTNSTILYISREQTFENNFNIDNFDTIEKLIYSYLTYKFYNKAIKDDDERQKILDSLLVKIKQLRLQIGDEKIIEYLSKFEFSKEQFDNIAKDMSLYFPILRDNVILTPEQYNYLKNINLCLYFIYSLSKGDIQQCMSILDGGKMTLINSLKDSTHFLWAKKHQLFPEIDNIEELSEDFNRAKQLKLLNISQDEELYLLIIVEKILKSEIRENNNEIYVLTKLSEYICNLFSSYPYKFVCELFKQGSQKK